jgi:hypothetical protein
MNEALPNDFLASEEALDHFMHSFFDHSLPKAEWNHAGHVAMAAYLLYDSDVDAALPKVRKAIRTYIEATGGRNTASNGYHETLTVFWMRVVAAKLRELQAASRLEAVRGVVAAYGEARRLHTLYYSHDLHAADAVARRQWVEPDLRQI